MADVTESARKAMESLAKKMPAAKSLNANDYLSTGLTVLNLACSNRAFGGLEKGSINRLIGVSQTAKTVLGLYCLCEATLNPAFKDYDLIHNNIERGLRMEVKKFWPPLVKRLQPPLLKDGKPVYPVTLTDYYRMTTDRLKKGRPCVELVDSFDALDAPVIVKEDRNGKGKEVSALGKMGDGKAKANAQEMRRLLDLVDKTGSIIIFIQHAKPNMGSSWAEYVTSGGVSPEFYSSLDIWLGKREKIKRSYKPANLSKEEADADGEDFGNGEKRVSGIELPVGQMFEAHVKKNRTNGVDRTVKFPLYNEYGIDDTAACVKWLVEMRHWSRSTNGVIHAPEFGLKGYELQIVKGIEEVGKLKELRLLVRQVWLQVEQALSMGRRSRYG